MVSTSFFTFYEVFLRAGFYTPVGVFSPGDEVGRRALHISAATNLASF